MRSPVARCQNEWPKMIKQRQQTAMRRVALMAAILSLSLSSLLPSDCCRAAQRARGDGVAAELPCCMQQLPAAFAEHCGAACCVAEETFCPAQPAEELPCHCQLQPREGQPFVTVASSAVPVDDAVVVMAGCGDDLVSPQQQPLAFLSGTGPPQRPLRVLYGVWRN